jgi:hypothetical protein
MIRAGVLLSRPIQDLVDLILGHAVIEDVRQSRFGIGPESQFHAPSLFGDSL